jgi:hypothetical protein
MPHRPRRRSALLTTSAVLGLLAVAACAPIAAPAPTPAPAPARTGTQNGSLGGCPVFPADNPWNADISALPKRANSDALIAQIQADGADFLHADFGGGGAYGIPYVTVPADEPMVSTHFFDWPGESDPGPYPVPLGAPIEGGSDRHVLAVQQGACKLYEMYNASPGSGRWEASNGAVFDLRSNALRPAGWTSADAAGLPIFAGLVRYDEVAAGVIRHALRVTFSRTQAGYVRPATHLASSDTNPNRPPMGLRLRLEASFDLSGFHGQARVILQAMKTYGLLVADNGSNWFVTGAADSRWDDDDLDQLKSVPGTAFEALDTGPILTG